MDEANEIEIDDDDELFKSVAGKMVNFESGLSLARSQADFTFKKRDFMIFAS